MVADIMVALCNFIGGCLYMRILIEQISIEAPADDVWAVLEDFGGVAKWAPNMRRSKLVGSQATDVGARRIMHHHLGV